MDVLSKLLIFFIFMVTSSDNKGQFSPMRTLISFYVMVGLMIIFNIVFNKRRNFGSINYWLGEFYLTIILIIILKLSYLEIVVNSFSSTLR